MCFKKKGALRPNQALVLFTLNNIFHIYIIIQILQSTNKETTVGTYL